MQRFFPKHRRLSRSIKVFQKRPLRWKKSHRKVTKIQPFLRVSAENFVFLRFFPKISFHSSRFFLTRLSLFHSPSAFLSFSRQQAPSLFRFFLFYSPFSLGYLSLFLLPSVPLLFRCAAATLTSPDSLDFSLSPMPLFLFPCCVSISPRLWLSRFLLPKLSRPYFSPSPSLFLAFSRYFSSQKTSPSGCCFLSPFIWNPKILKPSTEWSG